jgi:hypothetical protein
MRDDLLVDNAVKLRFQYTEYCRSCGLDSAEDDLGFRVAVCLVAV